MLGTIVNTLSVVTGSLVGMILKGGIPKKYADTVMQGIGLSVILIGLKGALKSDDILLIIASLAIGSLVGEIMRIEDGLEWIGKWLEKKFSSFGDGIAKGFVSASLLFCVGSMAIVGSLESGLSGNHQTLFAKSILDGVASIILSSTLGLGVAFSSLSVLIYQGTITICASYIKPFLSVEVIGQMSSVGGLLIMAIGVNLLELKKISVGNMLPAIAIPFVYDVIRRLITML